MQYFRERRAVVKRDVVHDHVATERAREPQRAHRVPDRRFRLEQVEYPTGGADSFLIGAKQRRERADRARDIEGVKQKRDEGTGGETSRQYLTSALPEDC